ncbi:MAG TPA: metallopeptidase family protein [Gammaproteobacteria bacterium]|nr:metallopeptidase family protein [Gammaproteobacteria bacterium]
MRKVRRRAAGTVTPAERELFDREFAEVLRTLPPVARKLLQTIPVAVDDYPSAEIQAEMEVEDDELFGLYTGTPAIERSFDQAGTPGDVIHIYRLALLRDASERKGTIDVKRLREQIQTTLLHELGHYHGFDDDSLDRLGY